MSVQQDIALHLLGEGPAKGPHVALVPGAEVPLLTLELPAGLRGSAREEVARRQFRDRIGGSGENFELRPFFAEKDNEGWHRALVADSARLIDWRAKAGEGCQAVLPDYLALPAGKEIWSILADKDSVQARLGLEDGFSAEPELAFLLLEQALERGDPPAPKAVLLQGPLVQTEAIAGLMKVRGIALAEEAGELESLGLTPPERFAHGELRFDLRSDPNAERDRLRRKILPWRWPLLLGLLAAGLWAAAQLLAVQALERELVSERSATLSVVRKYFVPSGPVLDIRSQVVRVLDERHAAFNTGRQGTTPLALFERAAEVIATTEAAAQEFSYDQEVLTAVVQTANFAEAEALVAALRVSGIAVEVVELRTEEGNSGVRAELRLRMAT